MRHIKSAFTLIEILVALCLFGITSLALIVGYHTFRQRMLSQRDQMRLQQAVLLARNVSLANYAEVVLRANSHQQDSARDWCGGFDLLLRSSKNKLYYHFQACQKGARLVWRGAMASEALHFSPNLLHQATNGRFFYYSSGRGQPSWEVVVNRLGETRVHHFSHR